MKASYVDIDQEVYQEVDPSDLDNITALIESSIRLTTDRPLTKVITSLTYQLDSEEPSRGGYQINILLTVDKQSRAVVFGKKFTNIQSLRKLISNISGKRSIFYSLEVKE